MGKYQARIITPGYKGWFSGKAEIRLVWFEEMKHTYRGHSANKDNASNYVLIYLADSVLEERQGADMH